MTDKERDEAEWLEAMAKATDACATTDLDDDGEHMSFKIGFKRGWADAWLAGRESLRADLTKIQALREQEFFEHSREIAQALRGLDAERERSRKLVQRVDAFLACWGKSTETPITLQRMREALEEYEASRDK